MCSQRLADAIYSHFRGSSDIGIEDGTLTVRDPPGKSLSLIGRETIGVGCGCQQKT